jgi:hypothetical protein
VMDLLARTYEMAFASILVTGIFAIAFYYVNKWSEERDDNNTNPLHHSDNWDI